MKPYLRSIDTATTGNRYDVTPLFANSAHFNALVDDLISNFNATQIDYVAGIDALGFILGTAIAQRLGVGLIAIRKGGKLPVATDSLQCQDYSGQTKALEIRRDILPAGAHVLLVDEWIETGAQATAAIKLIEGRGAVIAGIATINMDENEKTNALRAKYPIYTVWEE